VAPWWSFSCKPKHVGAVFFILKCFNNSTFFNVVCISWTIKCWTWLMHGVNMKFIPELSTMYISFSCRCLVAEPHVRYWASPFEFCGEQKGTSTGFPLVPTAFHCPYYFANVPQVYSSSSKLTFTGMTKLGKLSDHKKMPFWMSRSIAQKCTFIF